MELTIEIPLGQRLAPSYVMAIAASRWRFLCCLLFDSFPAKDTPPIRPKLLKRNSLVLPFFFFFFVCELFFLALCASMPELRRGASMAVAAHGDGDEQDVNEHGGGDDHDAGGRRV